MKNLPTVVASPSRDIAVELVAFDGSHRIENRDATGFYFDVHLEPAGEPSRIAVLFSGTVMAVKPEAFGLPAFGDRQSTFITFAEAAIGDFLDDSGFPEFTAAGAPAAKIDCFSPHFQVWQDRQPAPDDAVQAYLFAHVIQAWKYGHPDWTLGPSDLLRLKQSRDPVLRIARLYEGEAWSITNKSDYGAMLTPLPAFLRHQVARKPAPASPPSVPTPTAESVPPELSPAAFVYVDEARIADLRRLESNDFDLRKLIALCEELNQSYRAQCYHAVAALTRAVIDHVPPIFGYRIFSEVTNNYSGTKSFKDCMRRLEDAARKIADAHLHTPIRDSEVLPTRVQVNFSNEVDVLLGRSFGGSSTNPSRSRSPSRFRFARCLTGAEAAKGSIDCARCARTLM